MSLQTQHGPFTEKEVRAMRDRVFGQRSTDKNWEGCKKFWMSPEELQWLIEWDKKGKTNETRV